MSGLCFGRKTFCFHGSYLINAYLPKRAFPCCAFGQLLNLLGAFGKWNQPQTWIFFSFLFVFLCFGSFLPPSVCWLFKEFYSDQLSLCLILLEPQCPGTIQRMEKKFFFASEGSGSRHRVEFSWSVSYMFFTKTNKWKINKTTIKKAVNPALLFFFLKAWLGIPQNKAVHRQCEVHVSVTALSCMELKTQLELTKLKERSYWPLFQKCLRQRLALVQLDSRSKWYYPDAFLFLVSTLSSVVLVLWSDS